jgi:transcriptional regulator with XRE-family HTH domain
VVHGPERDGSAAGSGRVKGPVLEPDGGGDPDAVEGARAELLTLGRELRQLRRSRNRSLEQVADEAGVSVGLLSQLERGVGNPSYLTLAKIGQALGVPVAAFFGPDRGEDRFVVRRGDRKRLVTAREGAVFELLTPDLQGPFEMIWVELGPGVPEPETYQHPGTECVFLLEGRLTYRLGALTYELDAGDSMTFPGDLPHRAENPGPALARLVATVAPPSF